MTCPFCGREFSHIDKAELEQTGTTRADVDFNNIDIAGDEDPENDE